MFKNYLKISLAVLLRRKFLAFVNLFGTAVTLTVLVVAFAVFESIVSPAGAQSGHRHILTIDLLHMTGPNQGRAGGVGLAFYERYIEPLQTPDARSYSTSGLAGTSYVGGRKLTPVMRRTDAAYWRILDFDVLGGRTLTTDDVDRGRSVAVVNEATADAFFPGEAALGRTIVVNSDPFEVVGVVANEPETSELAYADVWVPLTAAQPPGYSERWLADGVAILYVEDSAGRGAVQDEYRQVVRNFEYTPDPTEFDSAFSAAETALEGLANQMYLRAASLADSAGVGAPRENLFADSLRTSNVARFLGATTVATLLFMLLPAVNMINLNVGRILERAPEIGLRKAAGASRRVLVGQFIFENVVLAALGGLLALTIAPLLLGLLNDTVFVYGALRLNGPVFVAGFAFIIVFGILSGAYPAAKMAGLEPAAALRGHAHV